MAFERMMEEKAYELLVVGGGPAGLTAGIFGGRSGLETVIVEKGICGGLSNEATVVENFPGFTHISGMELMEKIKEQAAQYAEIKELEEVKVVERRGEKMTISTEKGRYSTNALIFCMGTEKRRLGVKGEPEFLGRGVSYCATCDGFFFKNKSVLVVGGGDSAVRGALYLKNLGCEVTLIHRRDRLRAERYLQKSLEKAGVPILWNSVVREIKGDRVVRSVVRYDTVRGTEDELAVDGIFIYIGEEPASALARQLGVELTTEGYISTDRTQRTNIARVYAAGDITGGVKQIVVACAEGAIAAISAFEDLTGS